MNQIPKKTGIIFPGQGSQSLGMLKAFDGEIFQRCFQTASDILGYDLWDIIQNGPIEKLNQTAVTQPALLTASVALWQLKFKDCIDFEPVVLSGHSLGEYTALVCAEALSFKDAVYLVSERGRFMQEAVPEGLGAMAAIIGLDYLKISQICLDIHSDTHIVACANINAPGQVVIAGHTTAVEQAMAILKTAGAKLVKKLNVSVPSHCLLMKPAAEKMKELLSNCIIQSPKMPVLHNIDARAYSESAEIKTALIHQLFNPVQWIETIKNMTHNYPLEQIIECGPGKILTGLNKRIVSIPTFSVDTYN